MTADLTPAERRAVECLDQAELRILFVQRKRQLDRYRSALQEIKEYVQDDAEPGNDYGAIWSIAQGALEYDEMRSLYEGEKAAGLVHEGPR